MPLPLAPLLPYALRIGLMTVAALAVRRFVAARSFPGRTDQRAEDAFDELDEGMAIHHPGDRTDDAARQTNMSCRTIRVIRIGGRRIEIDAAVMTRFRLRKE